MNVFNKMKCKYVVVYRKAIIREDDNVLTKAVSLLQDGGF